MGRCRAAARAGAIADGDRGRMPSPTFRMVARRWRAFRTKIAFVAGPPPAGVKAASEPGSSAGGPTNPAYHFQRIGREAGPLPQRLYSSFGLSRLPGDLCSDVARRLEKHHQRISTRRHFITDGVSERIERNMRPVAGLVRMRVVSAVGAVASVSEPGAREQGFSEKLIQFPSILPPMR